ncbi:hypothetical protein TSUD_343320 [Trifolium subterraneum]|nr:hypothetical protein TSUD_343320 [Trifolium subterraneum]
MKRRLMNLERVREVQVEMRRFKKQHSLGPEEAYEESEMTGMISPTTLSSVFIVINARYDWLPDNSVSR